MKNLWACAQDLGIETPYVSTKSSWRIWISDSNQNVTYFHKPIEPQAKLI
jgi:hypothetical protein